MPRTITLSRAARLVGVKRDALQQKIREGELRTFEGALLLSDLLHAYPQVQVEDTAMVERLGQIMESAVNKIIHADEEVPDCNALATRIVELNRELAKARSESRRYRELIENLKLKLGDLDRGECARDEAFGEFRNWFDGALNTHDAGAGEADTIAARETFPRTMAARVRVLPSGHEFLVEGKESLLEAGQHSGLALNYGCSNGICGLCKAKVVSGKVSKIRLHDYALTETEKALGYILTCCNTAEANLVIEADEASNSHDIPLQEIDIRVKKITRPDDSTIILYTKTPRTRRLRFLAGQYLSLKVGDLPARDCSIASCPCDDMNLEFHIPYLSGQPFSDHLVNTLKPNDTITLRGPRGEFNLNEDSRRSPVFIAWNAGFGPVKSLIEHVMSLNISQEIHLYWVTTDENSHYLDNQCRSWSDALDNFHYRALTLEKDQVVEDVLPEILGDLAAPQDCDFYGCVPGPLLETMASFLVENGLPPRQLHMEPVRQHVSPRRPDER